MHISGPFKNVSNITEHTNTNLMKNFNARILLICTSVTLTLSQQHSDDVSLFLHI